MSNERVRGVDFGTSTSLVAESTLFQPEIVPLGATTSWLPSVAGLDGSTWYVGEDAGSLPEDQILRSVKRAITNNLDRVSIFNGVKRIDVEADSAIEMILRSIAKKAQDNFVPVDEPGSVRLGCPAMWTGDQRRRLITLANKAGIAVGDNTLIDEPIAAGVAWITEQARRNVPIDGKLLVFDMGGGTLDVAVLSVVLEESGPSISVQSAIGIDEAGDALDDLIVLDLERKYSDLGIALKGRADYEEIHGWMVRAARDAKIELGTEHETTVVIGYPGYPLPSLAYSRSELEIAFKPQLDRAMASVELALRAGLMSQVGRRGAVSRPMSPSRARSLTLETLRDGVDYVLLAGGMAHVPAIFNRMAEYFPSDQIYGASAVEEPTETIVRGLAEDQAYERLNLHRPGFDFVITWRDSATDNEREVLVYPAYEPLYTHHTVIHTDSVEYRWTDEHRELQKFGQGQLRVRSVSGEAINFKFAHEEVPFVPVNFGQSAPVLKLDPSGRVFIRDGNGSVSTMRISQWPVIRGQGSESIQVEDTDEPGTQIRRWASDYTGD